MQSEGTIEIMSIKHLHIFEENHVHKSKVLAI